MDGFSPLNVLRKARSNHEWKRWRQITAFFLVELRALALAVLAVQSALPRAGLLAFLQRSRIDRFVAGACSRQGLTALPYEQKPRRKRDS